MGDFAKLYANAHATFKSTINLASFDSEDESDIFPLKSQSVPAKPVAADVINLEEESLKAQAIVIDSDEDVILKNQRVTRATSRKTNNAVGSRGKGKRKRGGKNNIVSDRFTITVSSDSEPEIDFDKSVELEEDQNYSQIVLVKWMYKTIHRISLRRFQKLSMIQERLSELENTESEKILLTLNDKLLDPNECLHSLNITIKDIIDATIISTDRANLEATFKSSVVSEPQLSFKIQLKNRKKPIIATIGENEKLRILFEKVRAELDFVPFNNLKFKFDGDLLLPTKTAAEQDLEGGECIDLEINSEDIQIK